MTTEQLAGILRALLAAFGGVLVTKGYVDNATLNTVVGGLVEAGVAVWSYRSNHPDRVEVKK